jgi:hypothetical protein
MRRRKNLPAGNHQPCMPQHVRAPSISGARTSFVASIWCADPATIALCSFIRSRHAADSLRRISQDGVSLFSLQSASAPTCAPFLCSSCYKPLADSPEAMAGLRHNHHGSAAEGILL